MSVQSEIDRIITAVGNAYSKVSKKGGTVPASQTVSNLAAAIDSIPAGSSPSLQSKSVTYTENGTATITPDSGYDGLSSVDVTVNVSGGGGSVENEGCIVQIKGTFNTGGSIAYAELKNGTITTKLQYFTGKITLNNFISINVLKNSLFVASNTTKTFSTEGNVVSGMTGKDGYFPFWVTGDCKINFS